MNVLDGVTSTGWCWCSGSELNRSAEIFFFHSVGTMGVQLSAKRIRCREKICTVETSNISIHLSLKTGLVDLQLQRIYRFVICSK